MPSALSAKIEKQSSPEVVIDNSTPIRQVLVVIEHKIRNLEKRKNKLDSYRDLAKSGKDLSSDQRLAVAKYDEVTQSLEFARELSKQIHGIAVVTEKDHKKQLKKEAAIKFQQETFKISQSILLQTILSELLTVADIRNDFLNGTNGALKLETSEIELLDKYYAEITLSKPIEIDDAVIHNVAEHIMNVVDNKPKAFGDTTYDCIFVLIEKIYMCGYFGKKQTSIPTNEESIPNTNVDEEQEILINGEETKNADVGTNQAEEICVQQQQQQVVVHHQLGQDPVQQPEMIVVASSVVPIVTPQQCDVIPQPNFTEAPAAAAVPAPSFPPPSQNAALVQQASPVIIPPLPGVVAQPVGLPPNCAVHIPPTTVRAVEQGYFKQHQYLPQMRPLTEVIGTGKFFFLQDSELDSPDIMPGGFQNISQVPPPTAQQSQPPQQHNPQVSPSPLAVVQQSIPPQNVQVIAPAVPPPQGVVQSTGPPNIPTHTFSNQNFPNIVQSNPLFGNMKGNEINPQNAHIPAFVQANPAIALAPSATTSGSVPQQGQPGTGQQSEMVHIIFSGGQQHQQQFQQTQSSPMPLISQQSQKQDTVDKTIEQHHQQPPVQSVHIVQNQKIQSNNEWNKQTGQEVRQQSAHHLHQQQHHQSQHIEESNEWTNRTSEIKEWNNDCVNDNMQSMDNSSNTWNAQSGDNGYGGTRGYRGRGGRDGGGPRSIRGNGTSNGYRSRPNTYPQNNGSTRSNGGGGNAFYRNNSDNYYQNTNGSGGGGGGNSYNNNKSDNYQGNGGGGGYKTRGAPSGPERNPLRGPPRTQTANTSSSSIGVGPDKSTHIGIRAAPTNRDPRSITGGNNGGNGNSGIHTRPARGGAPSGPPLGSAYGGPRVSSSPRSQQQPLNT